MCPDRTNISLLESIYISPLTFYVFNTNVVLKNFLLILNISNFVSDGYNNAADNVALSSVLFNEIFYKLSKSGYIILSNVKLFSNQP
jgi:hypothetical protein